MNHREINWVLVLLFIVACQRTVVQEVGEIPSQPVKAMPPPLDTAIPSFQETAVVPTDIESNLSLREKPSTLEVAQVNSSFLTVTYDLEPGPNFIPVSMFTALTSHDIISTAGCNATELQSQIIDTNKLAYSPSKRLIHTIATEPIAITAHEVYLLYCEDKGELTIQGILAPSKPLQFDGNYIVVHSPTSGKELLRVISCDPTFMLKDTWVVQDGSIRKTSGDTFLVQSNDGSRWNVSGLTTVFIRCGKDGEYNKPLIEKG